ncbi:hypothetical protein M8J77_016411 [Diaphorina citri]|nr:hypothetical protein M8J77_016411 [Diaphorina citri]
MFCRAKYHCVLVTLYTVSFELDVMLLSYRTHAQTHTLNETQGVYQNTNMFQLQDFHDGFSLKWKTVSTHIKRAGRRANAKSSKRRPAYIVNAVDWNRTLLDNIDSPRRSTALTMCGHS